VLKGKADFAEINARVIKVTALSILMPWTPEMH
jgi:hypothetical protein